MCQTLDEVTAVKTKLTHKTRRISVCYMSFWELYNRAVQKRLSVLNIESLQCGELQACEHLGMR